MTPASPAAHHLQCFMAPGDAAQACAHTRVHAEGATRSSQDARRAQYHRCADKNERSGSRRACTAPNLQPGSCNISDSGVADGVCFFG